MEYLYNRYVKYKKESDGKKDKSFLESLKAEQFPSSLLITCSDSRLLPSEFTQSNAGDTFTIRNAGNLVSSYDDKAPTSEAISLEFAVEALKVKEIIVCGHLECGAMDALYKVLHNDSSSLPPLLKKFLGHHYRSVDSASITGLNANELVFENVKIQMLHLMSYPFVREKLQAGELSLWGWVFNFVIEELIEKINYNDI